MILFWWKFFWPGPLSGLMCGTCIAIGGGLSMFVFIGYLLPSLREDWVPLMTQ
jgi:hypothetical protein